VQDARRIASVKMADEDPAQAVLVEGVADGGLFKIFRLIPTHMHLV
jgi:hypothetical protein